MAFDPLPYAAPVFVLALVVEGWLVRYSQRSLISGLGCVAVDQITAAWGLALFVTAFDAAHRSAGLIDPHGIAKWVIAVVAHDFAYYLFHRASHRIHVLWAAHVVHHQSATYDFTVSLRQGSIATWVTYAFYLPVALVVDAQTFLIIHAAYQVYQFFVHTRLVRTLGPLEWLLATPSHHRVHHGSQRAHLDRNYGGFFIVFDRLLGTFTPETHEPVYGVPGGYDIASPMFANTYMFLRLIAASAKLPTVRERLRLWWGPPEAGAHLVSSAGHARNTLQHAAPGRTWLVFAAGLAGAITVALVPALPCGATVAIGATSVVLVELACRRFDSRVSTS
ncbi:MAG: sterol desaturase family protein [Kofleriaceae bacterium]